MKKRLIALIGIIIVIGGIQGIRSYNKYRCTNIQSANWEHYKLANCAIYHNENSDTDLPEKFVKVRGAHVRTFVEIDKPYAKDKRAVYYKTEKVAEADAMSFRYRGGEYFIDQNSVFWRGKTVVGSRSSTFELFPADARYGKDSINEYFNGEKIRIASLIASTRFLLSPFDGEEVTINKGKEIFWRPVEIEGFTGMAIVLVDDKNGFTWLSDERVQNNGRFIWTPNASSSPDATYHLIFYAHKGGEVVKLDTKNKFSIVENGKPGVVLLVNFSDDEKVRVDPDEVVYMSWASGNVERCYLIGGLSQPLTGHMTIKFPQVGDAKATEYYYNIECITSSGYTVNDFVKIESIVPDQIVE